MALRIPTTIFLLGALALFACSGDDDDVVVIRDGGTSVRDAGEEARDGGVVDAGEVERDGGVERDAGTRDGGVELDAGGCGPLETMCGDDCVDVFADDAHCGDCGQACTGGAVCLSGVCGPPPATNVAAVPARTIVPGCTTAGTSSSKLAVDPSNRIFVGMVCSDMPYVVRSDDLGATFAAPEEITIPSLERFEIHAAAPDVLYLVGRTEGAALVFSKSTDGGATWSSPRVVDAGPVSLAMISAGPNVRSWRNHVYLFVTNGGGTELRVWRNDALGDGAFSLTAIPFTMPFGGGLDLDTANGDVWVFVDTFGRAEAYRSTDNGASFTRAQTLMGIAVANQYAVAPGNQAYTRCGTPVGSVCTARVDLSGGAVQPLTLAPELFAASPFGLGLAARADGGAYLGARRIETTNSGFVVAEFGPTDTAATDLRIVTTSTTVDLGGGVDLSVIAGTTGVATVFTSSVGVAASVEVF